MTRELLSVQGHHFQCAYSGAITEHEVVGPDDPGLLWR